MLPSRVSLTYLPSECIPSAQLNRLLYPTQVLRVYASKPDGAVRERAVNAMLYLLKKYVEYKTNQTGPKNEKLFEGLGSCLAFIIPRCTDPVVTVRQRALEAVGIALCTSFKPSDSKHET